MNIKFDNDNALGLSGETPVNPLDIAESYEFHRKGPEKLFYRDRALERCLEAEVQFNSTANSLRNMAQAYLQVTCPYCMTVLHPTQSSGNSELASFEFVCPADEARVTITLPWNGINICPKNPQK